VLETFIVYKQEPLHTISNSKSIQFKTQKVYKKTLQSIIHKQSTTKSSLKLPFRSHLINFFKKYFKKVANIYMIIKASYEGICAVFERKKY